MILRYLDKDDSEDRQLSMRLSRCSMDMGDPAMETKKPMKNQLLARSLHSCQRSQVRKWVDEDDQKFMLMKCVNEVGLGGSVHGR